MQLNENQKKITGVGLALFVLAILFPFDGDEFNFLFGDDSYVDFGYFFMECLLIAVIVATGLFFTRTQE